MLTIEPVNALLSLNASKTAVDPLILEAKVLQKVLQDVQHPGHLRKEGGEGGRRGREEKEGGGRRMKRKREEEG